MIVTGEYLKIDWWRSWDALDFYTELFRSWSDIGRIGYFTTEIINLNWSSHCSTEIWMCLQLILPLRLTVLTQITWIQLNRIMWSSFASAYRWYVYGKKGLASVFQQISSKVREAKIFKFMIYIKNVSTQQCKALTNLEWYNVVLQSWGNISRIVWKINMVTLPPCQTITAQI